MTTDFNQENDRKSELEVLTSATIRAAGLLNINNKELAAVIGVSPSTISKLRKGGALLPNDAKVLEISKFFLRLYRSLDAIVGGSQDTAASWLRSRNDALNAVPIQEMFTIRGLFRVTAYLDQRRAPL
jgi:transcriptional regulator with XRE-family HTH domain